MQQSAIAEFAYFFRPNLSLAFSGGPIINGNMSGDGLELDVETGFVFSLRLARRFIEEKGARPFLSLAVMVSFSRSPFEDGEGNRGHLIASDIRGALTVGYTLFNVWQLYLSPRLFGGPIFITYADSDDSIQGRDRFFVQAGMGMSFLLPKGITLYIDGSPAGEQTIAAGLAFFIPVG